MNDKPTPETDAMLGTFPTHEGRVAFGIKEIEALIDSNRKLERERDEVRAQYQDIISVADMMRPERETQLLAERDELRKVCDALHVSLLNCSPMHEYPSTAWSIASDKRHDALTTYNSLPHRKGKQ